MPLAIFAAADSADTSARCVCRQVAARCLPLVFAEALPSPAAVPPSFTPLSRFVFFAVGCHF